MFVTREHAVAVARNVGRQHGYAVAVHGSLIKDVDLIAVPWVSRAKSPQQLADAIALALPGTIHQPLELQPHARLACTILPNTAFGADRWWIDLSVMPRSPALPRRHKSERPVGNRSRV